MLIIDGTWLWHNIIALNIDHDFKFDLGCLPQKLITHLSSFNNITYQYTNTILCASLPKNVHIDDIEITKKREDFFTLLQNKYNFITELYDIDFKGNHIYKSARELQSDFKPKEKCVDIATASNLLFHANQYDTVILVTGDSDFIPAINKVLLLNKQLIVASFQQSCSHKLLQNLHTNYSVLFMNHILDTLLLTQNITKCQSKYHIGDPYVKTTYMAHDDRKFFCHTCRNTHNINKNNFV